MLSINRLPQAPPPSGIPLGGRVERREKMVFIWNRLCLAMEIRWHVLKGGDVTFIFNVTHVIQHPPPPSTAPNKPDLTLHGRHQWDVWSRMLHLQLSKGKIKLNIRKGVHIPRAEALLPLKVYDHPHYLAFSFHQSRL